MTTTAAQKKKKAWLCSWFLICLGTSAAAAALLVGLIARIMRRTCRSPPARPRPSSVPRSSRRVARDSLELRVRLSEKVLGLELKDSLTHLTPPLVCIHASSGAEKELWPLLWTSGRLASLPLCVVALAPRWQPASARRSKGITCALAPWCCSAPTGATGKR